MVVGELALRRFLELDHFRSVEFICGRAHTARSTVTMAVLEKRVYVNSAVIGFVYLELQKWRWFRWSISFDQCRIGAS